MVCSAISYANLSNASPISIAFNSILRYKIDLNYLKYLNNMINY